MLYIYKCSTPLIQVLFPGPPRPRNPTSASKFKNRVVKHLAKKKREAGSRKTGSERTIHFWYSGWSRSIKVNFKKLKKDKLGAHFWNNFLPPLFWFFFPFWNSFPFLWQSHFFVSARKLKYSRYCIFFLSFTNCWFFSVFMCDLTCQRHNFFSRGFILHLKTSGRFSGIFFLQCLQSPR